MLFTASIAIVLVVDHTFFQPRSQYPGNEEDLLQCQLKAPSLFTFIEYWQKETSGQHDTNISIFKLNASFYIALHWENFEEEKSSIHMQIIKDMDGFDFLLVRKRPNNDVG